MKKCVVFALSLFFLCFLSLGLSAQVNPTGSLTGVVTDPSGASIPGATVTATDPATKAVLTVQSDVNGRFVLSNLSPDSYDVVVSHTGFQSGAYHAVVIQVGQTYTLKAQLKVGQTSQTVEVQAGQQVIETESTQVSGQVTGQQVTQIPIASRNAQDLAIIMPAMQTTGSPRNSQFNGLPPGAVNLTVDGINSQDNLLKSTTGSSFFSTEQPRIDDVQEFNVTSAANDASSSGEGAVQVAVVSKKGTNQFHGGGWEYLRNNWLNANNYFNNINHLPRQPIRLNEFGYKIGGPILKNKLFFFTDLDWWENPQAQARTRNVLTPSAMLGQFTYAPTKAQTNAPNAWTSCNGSGENTGQPTGTCTADLMAMAAAKGFNGTVDTTEAAIQAEVAKAVGAPGLTVGTSSNFNNVPLNFNALAASHRKYPDVRLDYTINATNSLEYDYHYDHYFDGPDVLNNADATYPIAPFNTNVGSQISDRNLMALAWRWQASPTINNELRIGGTSAPTWFGQGENDTIYPTITATTAAGVSSTVFVRPSAPSLESTPFLSFNPQGRNTALGQANETMSWLHGNHSMSIGGSFTAIRLKENFGNEPVASLGLGLSSSDPAAGIFGSANMPGLPGSQISSAGNLWAVLSGRVTSFNQTINANPTTRAYQANFNEFDQISQKEWGLFFNDSWHVTPGLTFNYGLRYEVEGVPTDDLNKYSVPVGGVAGVYGISGMGNIFKPGTETGAVTQFENDKGHPFYNSYHNGWAPSVGLAWTPNVQGGILQSLFGNNGDSVLRAGYSIAYDRQGLSEFTAMAPANPGPTNNAFLTAVGTVKNPGDFSAGSIQFQNGAVTGAAQEETQPFGSVIPINPGFGDSVNATDPGLAQPMVQSWQLGIQRQLDRNTALEVRYVGNHATRGWTTGGLNENEVNIFENGFLTEFNNALGNLNACNAAEAKFQATNPSPGTAGPCDTPSFANLGISGQKSVPILTAAFTGSKTGSQTASGFINGTFVSDLQNGLAGSLAASLDSANNVTFWQQATAAGLPSNEFTVNPDATGGTFLLTDFNQSTYNGLQTELRRRMSQGLQFDVNYTYSHSLGTTGLQSLRFYGNSKGPSGSDLRHVFKVESLYELPFGSGHQLKTGWSWLDSGIAGWQWTTVNRWQSGDLITLSGGLGGTFNQNDGGVQFAGTNTVQTIAGLVGVSKQTTSAGKGVVFFAPNALLGGGQQGANTSILAPCSTAGAFCEHPYLYGPNFFKADWSLSKTQKLTEGIGLTVRADVLDIFNNINFSTPASGNLSSTSFMRITSAYSDFTSTQDPGGRLIQLVFRLDF